VSAQRHDRRDRSLHFALETRRRASHGSTIQIAASAGSQLLSRTLRLKIPVWTLRSSASAPHTGGTTVRLQSTWAREPTKRLEIPRLMVCVCDNGAMIDSDGTELGSTHRESVAEHLCMLMHQPAILGGDSRSTSAVRQRAWHRTRPGRRYCEPRRRSRRGRRTVLQHQQLLHHTVR